MEGLSNVSIAPEQGRHPRSAERTQGCVSVADLGEAGPAAQAQRHKEQCFSFGRMNEATALATVTVQDDCKLGGGSWSAPYSDIIRLIIDHLKIVDRWRWEGRALRLTNRTWCRTINQCITEVKPHESRATTMCDVVEASSKFKGVHSVDLSGCTGRCTEESFGGLLGLAHLTTVRLSGLCVTDSGMPMLAKSPSIKHLSLIKVMVTDMGLGAVGKMEQLESLELKGLDFITSAALGSVSGVSTLKVVLCTLVTDEGMTKLGSYENLVDLTVMLVAVGDAGISVVMDLTKLTRLTLLCHNSTGAGLSKISQLASLKELSLREMEDIDLPIGICKLTSLRQLSMYKSNKICGEDLECIMSMNLTSLRLYGMDKVQRTDLTRVAKMGSLMELGIGQMNIVRSADLGSLCALTCLTKLNLQRCHNIGNTGVALLTRLTNLRELFLHNCDRVGRRGVEYLVPLQHLEKLTVGPNMDDACVSVISLMPNLRQLGFVLCNDLTVGGLRPLRRMARLRDLCLDWCNVFATSGSREFKALAKLFFIDLDHVGLHPFRLTDDIIRQIRQIAPPLKVDSNVTWVWEW
ncbi:hypothetical protein BSKO_10197 [Bryopsis sp. KO-2023]|nr:hypothetical protein BSKO_10197 [Bryopsis sp. KO-2023]